MDDKWFGVLALKSSFQRSKIIAYIHELSAIWQCM